MMNFEQEFNKAQRMVGILKAAGYTQTSIVGGALRNKMLGGGTSDIDIAIICDDLQDYANLSTDLRLFFGVTNAAHDKSGYASTDGFMGDWRIGDINIIAYSKYTYTDIPHLIARFDLNINQWEFDTFTGRIVNRYFDGKVVKINPFRDGDYKAQRLAERIHKFKTLLPNLDWSNVDA